MTRRSRSLVARDLACNWHPYTQMHDCARLPPIPLVRARGNKLYAADGSWYYDTIASWWCNVHGHCHPAITRAVSRQLATLDHVMFAGFTHQPAVELSEQLVALAPRGLARVFYSDDGSTAVETALKLSVQYWHNRGERRSEFIALDHGYHGDTVGAMSVSSVDTFTAPFAPLCFPTRRVTTPYCYRCPLGRTYPSCRLACLAALERVLQRRARHVAALILEPLVCCAGGMIVYPAAWLRAAARLARHYGVHLIADEVATGFGRTGTMFACEQAGIAPDFLCLGKGLTGGTLTLGATLTTEKVYRGFYAPARRGRTFYHGHTFTANPAACAAALASLALFRRERTLTRIRPLVRRLHAGLAAFRDLPLVGNVRCCGLIGALELVRDRAARTPQPVGRETMLAIYRAGLEQHLLLRPLGNVLYFFLPHCTQPREFDTILAATRRILIAVCRKLPHA
ncbi:MAG TPA: adenosylmethionine--8-amino-7-oxononanoate transaminase [bacterium]|nr:adenosylmethionine--8-amino-7-oxononanoate transaminase [bacterium]